MPKGTPRASQSSRARPLWALATLSIFLGAAPACGGASAPPPAAAGHAGGGAAGAGAGVAAELTPERCIETAGAKRTRRPDEPEKIVAKHVLVKYAGAKRALAAVTRTRGEACLRAEEVRTKLKGGMSFEDVVRSYSEEAGAASREGSLGEIRRSDVVPAFADAAFELAPGEVSHVVETPFGFHVILRTE